MAFLFKPGGNTQAAQPPAPVAAFRVQTSALGKPWPKVYGTVRMPANLLWYGDFYSVQSQSQPAQGGGKGGLFSSPVQSTSSTYDYFVSVALGICSGPISSFGRVFIDKAVYDSPADFGMTLFTGTYPQSPWTYLTTNHPGEALGYNGFAYAAVQDLALGNNSSLPNFNFEIYGPMAIPGSLDADASLIIPDLLTNPYDGAGFPAALMGNLTQYQDYVYAANLLISVVYQEQQPVAQMIDDIGLATNSAPVWNGVLFKMIPWGDETITGNGKTYVPPSAPDFDLTDDDFQDNQGGPAMGSAGSSADPVVLDRKRPADKANVVKVEFLNRTNSYNTEIVEAREQALIDKFGKRQAPSAQGHMFANADCARASAQLNLQRGLISNYYTFTLDARYAAIDPMDIETITDSLLGLDQQWVRVIEITETDDDRFVIVAEEYLQGTGAAALYSFQQGSGFTANTNEAPGDVLPPTIFEPTDQLAGALEVWLGVCGESPALWGGAYVWVSTDGENYQQMPGRILGPARMGVLSAPLASVTPSPIGPPTIDTANTLSVNLSESLGELLSGSQADALALHTLCYVDGEYVAYQLATLTAANQYDLTYLIRGALGTESDIVTHDAGAKFVRLDNGVFKIPYRQDQIGSTIYIKFTSFNIYGGGVQSLADAHAYAYTIAGTALTSPLPDVANVRTQFTDGFQYIYWDDVVDFRTAIRYQIFKGDSFAGAQQVGDNAHAPFIAFGNGTYWIRAYCQPLAGLYVFSENPISITISGSMLVQNLVFESDQQAAGWPGIFSNGVGIDGTSIRLGGSGDVLSEPDFLNIPDVLNYGGVIGSGTYEIRPQDYINVGYVADCYVSATWKATGVPVGQDILTIADFLAQPDILGSASTQYISVKVQIATAQSADEGDLYAAGDLYGVTPDLYGYGIAWSDWRDYVPGVYRAQLVKFRLLLTTIDGNTICYCLAFSYLVSVPPRIDHYPNLAVPSGGLTITFEPDDASIAAAFNGGPPVGGVGNQPDPFLSFSVIGHAGLSPVIDTLSLAAVTFHFEDSSHVPTDVSDCSVTAEGF